MKHINLEQFAGGKLSVQLNKALEKVTENIQDPNTDAQKVRKINVSISLRPYRTFLEVEQPESKFIFRIREGANGEPSFKLVEADGGLWKYKAVTSIKDYLKDHLPEVLLKSITIIG